MAKKTGKKTGKLDLFPIINGIIMVLFIVITLYPVLNTLAISLNDGTDALRGGIYLLPRKFTWKNYITVLQKDNLITGAYITVARTIIGTLLALVANAPFNAINSCVDMGASITMAKGAADGGLFPAVAVIGDSTFTHSGMTGLLDCVNENANVTIVISDNETTAMTGGQDSAGTGRIEAICAGLGVEPAHIRVVVPLKKNYEEMKQIIREEIEYCGVSVIIPRRECIQTLARKKRSK